MKKTPAVAYLRVSSKGQAGADKDGLPRQRDAIKRFAAQHGYSLVAEFRDEGVSGDIEDRPGIAELLERIASNGVRTVIIENTDRLARDLTTQEAIVAKLGALGARIITATGIDLSDTDDPMKTAIRQILGVIAQLDKSMIVIKLRKARDSKSKNGKRIEGRKPFGEKEGEAPILERMRELRKKRRGAERLSLQAIADTLNAEGIPTRAVAEWTKKKAASGDVSARPPNVKWTKNTVARIMAREKRSTAQPAKAKPRP